jgi:alpha-amylase
MKTTLILLIILFCLKPLFAQDPTSIQGFYWDVPAGGIWWDSLATKAADMGTHGIDKIWFPSPFKGSGGGLDMGYGIADHFDAGEFNQYGSTETRFGSRTELESAILAYHNQGMEVICDIVMNHTLGGSIEKNSFVHDYVMADRYPLFPFNNYMYVWQNAPVETYYLKIKAGANDFTETTQDDRVGYYSARPWFNHSSGQNADGQPNFEEWNIGDGDSGPFDAFEIDLPGRVMEGNISSVGDIDEYYIVHTGGYMELKLWSSDLGGDRDFKMYELYNANGDNVTDSMKIHTWTKITPASNRFPKSAINYHPNPTHNDLTPDYHDPVFGSDFCYWSGNTGDSLKAWGTWLTGTLGFDAYRFDVAKGIDPFYVADWMNQPAMTNRYAVAEHWSDAGSIKFWVDEVNNNLTGNKTMTGFDFPLRYALQSLCDNPNYDVRNLHSEGLYNNGLDGPYVSTFVNNHDVWRPYTSSHDPILNDLILAYAVIMTHPGTATLFWPDYYGGTWYNSDQTESFTMTGLKTEIDNLLEIRKAFVAGVFYKLTQVGSPVYKHADDRFGNDYSGAEQKVYITQREGGTGSTAKGGSILVINTHATDPLGAWVTVQNSIGASNLQDYTNNRSGTETIAVDNRVFVHAAPRSYSIWAKAGEDISLPVELISFNAKLTSEGVSISWVTASETENAFFEIERKKENGEFSTINNEPILAKGNSSGASYTFLDKTLLGTGTYFYRLVDVSIAGKKTVHDAKKVELSDIIPGKTELLQNYPNPFNVETLIQYNIASAQKVKLTLFDMSGKRIKVLVNNKKSAGVYKINLNVGDLASGVYVYVLQIETGFIQSQKFLLIK